MKIALIGYGKMGHAVEEAARQRGHTIVCTIDNDSDWDARQALLRQADMAVEFSTPATAVDNLRRCFALGLPVVSGTTGWDAYREAVEKECKEGGHALLTASNFSIGMNIMFALNEQLAKLMRGRDDYSVSISETHHIHKLDAPSGTAKSLGTLVEAHLGAKPEITAYREGEVPGIHTVTLESAVDRLTLTHEAFSREGLAAGAVIAARMTADVSGVHEFSELILG